MFYFNVDEDNEPDDRQKSPDLFPPVSFRVDVSLSNQFNLKLTNQVNLSLVIYCVESADVIRRDFFPKNNQVAYNGLYSQSDHCPR